MLSELKLCQVCLSAMWQPGCPVVTAWRNHWALCFLHPVWSRSSCAISRRFEQTGKPNIVIFYLLLQDFIFLSNYCYSIFKGKYKKGIQNNLKTWTELNSCFPNRLYVSFSRSERVEKVMCDFTLSHCRKRWTGTPWCHPFLINWQTTPISPKELRSTRKLMKRRVPRRKLLR